MIAVHFTVLLLLLFNQTPPDSVSPISPRPGPKPSALVAESNSELGLWLVNLARHQGHLVGRTDPRSASLQVLALLEAAVFVDPECAGAFYWLYDIEQRLGQADQAAKSLGQYVRLTPMDEAARIRLFEIGLDERQTAEKRLQFVEASLKSLPLPPAYESELRYWLAKLHFEKRDNNQAGKEIENSLRLNPMNIQARELAYEMYGETEADLQRVEMALQLIAINPTQAKLVWDLGEFLDRLSLHKRAQEWFNRAIAIHRGAESAKVPADFWHTLAMSYMNSEDWAKAKDAADAALEADPNLQVARLLRSNALNKLGKTAEAKADLAAVAKTYESRVAEVLSAKLSDEAATLAWFYCYYQPDKDKALRLAEVADAGPDASELAKLAHAYALRANGKTDDAVKLLQPLAATDQMAALDLARIDIERSKKSDAITRLYKAAAIQHSGIAFNQIRDLLVKFGEKAPEPPLRTKIVSALERFHRDIFDFPKRPGDFLKFSIRFVDQPLPALGPVDVAFRMENAGPFTMTFGEGFMVRPLVALTAKVSGPESVVFKDYLQVLMNSRSMLLPGDAVEKTVAIDVGPFREHLLKNCAATLPIEVSALLDPIYKNDELTQGPGTIAAAAIRSERPGLDTSSGAVEALIKQAEASDVSARIGAARTLGALLAHLEKAKSAAPTDAAHALTRLLTDRDWRVRANALVAASGSSMDAAMTSAAAPAVRDENAVVKLMAVRLFAAQHGDKFRPVLEELSKSDPNHFVRMIALSYLPESARTQASSGSAAAPP